MKYAVRIQRKLCRPARFYSEMSDFSVFGDFYGLKVCHEFAQITLFFSSFSYTNRLKPSAQAKYIDLDQVVKLKTHKMVHSKGSPFLCTVQLLLQ